MNVNELAEKIFLKLLVEKLESADVVVQIIGVKHINNSIQSKIEEKYGTNNIFYFTTVDESYDPVWVSQAMLIDGIVIVGMEEDDTLIFLENEQLKEFQEYAKNNFQLYETGLDVYKGFIRGQEEN